jgi:hypothetical protein
MDFNLREHIRAVLASTPGEDVEDLADAVFAATPADQYASAYRQALAPIVRVALAHAERPDLYDPQDSRLDQSAPDTHMTPIEPGQTAGGEEATDGSEPTKTTPLPAGPNLRNSRVALLRRSRYRESIWIGDGIYRHILDCTLADLEHAAAESEKLAAENEAAAYRYRKLVKIMAEYGAEKVGDLTEDQLREVLGDE